MRVLLVNNFTMIPREFIFIIVILAILYVCLAVFSYWWIRRVKREVAVKEREVKHQMYELAILKEISDRTGYSLNIQKILDVISGSLNQFLEYSIASYMLLGPEKIVFKVEINQSVSPRFLKDIRERMIKSLSALLGRDVGNMPIEETIMGALMLENVDEPVQSFFNIPLVIGGQLMGVLTVAHTKVGLYKEEEMTVLYKIVNQASQAVTNLEEVIKTEEGKISAMLESMVEGVVMTDREYRIVAVNGAARAIIGYTPTGTPTLFDIVEKFRPSFDLKEKLEESIKLDKTVMLEGAVVGDKYYQVIVSPVKSNIGDVKGEILGGVIILHDITHEKEALKMRNDFTSMMVHELRSPLGNIKKIGEMMKDPKILDDKKISREYVSMLYDSSSTMLDLVNDLLDVAKLEAGKFGVDKRPESIKSIIAERVKFFDTNATGVGIELKSLAVSGVPDFVEIDPKRISQVLNNLISNGIRYTKKGGTVTVACFIHKKGEVVGSEAILFGVPWVKEVPSLSVEEAGNKSALVPDSIVVAVTDTGEGVTPENMAKLWNKFIQFESSARQKDHSGTGLGLVIVKGIVEAHGGTVGAVSAIGQGSTFYFTLPL